MPQKKTGWLAKSTATKRGYVQRGVMLKRANLTQAQCDEFNGVVAEEAVSPEEIEVVVETVIDSEKDE